MSNCQNCMIVFSVLVVIADTCTDLQSPPSGTLHPRARDCKSDPSLLDVIITITYVHTSNITFVSVVNMYKEQ